MQNIKTRTAVYKHGLRNLLFAWLTILVFSIAGSQHALAQTTPGELQSSIIMVIINTLLLSEEEASPALTLDKSSNLIAYTGTGQTITYSYLLTNSGNTTLYAPYSISDDQIAVTCSTTPVSIAPGGTVTCTQTYDTAQADIDAGSIVNIASATAKDAAFSGNEVTSATDTVTVNGPAATPALTLGKSSDVSSYTTTGETITYSYLLTNSGNTTLYAPYSISDDQIAVTCPATPASIAPTGTVTCMQTYDTVQGDIDAGSIVNIASATAKDAASSGNDVTSATDTVTVNGPVSAPAINLSKVGTLVDGGDGQADAGDSITYVFTVANTGNVTLTGVTLADTASGVTISGAPIATLLPSASDNTTFTGSYTLSQGDVDAATFTNTATVTGTSPTGANVSDSDNDTQVLAAAPVISLLKAGTLNDGGDGRADVGDSIAYAFTVTNTGNVTLAGVTLSDTVGGVVISGGPIATLAPSAVDQKTYTGSYTLTQGDIDAAAFTNTATVTGVPPTGANVSDPDSHTQVLAAAPALFLNKVITAGSTHTAVGDTITYAYGVANVGNVTLAGSVTIVDDKTSVSCPALTTIGDADSDLDVGELVICTSSYSVVQADIDMGSVTNIATASADSTDSNQDDETATSCTDIDTDTLCDDLETTLFGNLDQVAKEVDGENWDFDGDGVSNGAELHIYLSDAKSVDTDGDGIEDAAEVFLGLDLNVSAALGDTLGGDTPADKALMHKLNRLTFGPTQAELDQIAALAGGFDEWLAAQMTPIGLPLAPPRDISAVAPLYSGSTYPLPYDCADPSYNPVDPAQRMRDCYVSRRHDDADIPATFRPMHSTKQLQSRMAMFWDNHFNTDLRSHNRGMQELMDEDNWFVNAFGNFRTLLGLNAKNYTMLEYLDLDDNRKYSPNENFPREVMELHSVGIDGEYKATDIAQLAYILTGWDHQDPRYIDGLCSSVTDIITCAPYVSRYAFRDDASNDLDGTGETGLDESARFDPMRIFFYKSYDHDDGLSDYDGDGILNVTKTLYAGLSYEITINSQGDAQGQDEGEQALDFLATHPHTARFICKKLAQEFVSDTPLQTTTDSCETVFLANSSEANQMGLVLADLLGSTEFNDPATQRNKLKDTQEVMLSMGRLLGWDATHPEGSYRDSLASWISDAEQPLLYKAEPTGYYEPAENWLNTNISLKRFKGLNNMAFDPQTQSFVAYFRDQLGLTASADIMQHLFLIMLGGHYDGHDVQLGSDYLNGADSGNPDNHTYLAFDYDGPYAELRIRVLIAYLAALPEFQLH